MTLMRAKRIIIVVYLLVALTIGYFIGRHYWIVWGAEKAAVEFIKEDRNQEFVTTEVNRPGNTFMLGPQVSVYGYVNNSPDETVSIHYYYYWDGWGFKFELM